MGNSVDFEVVEDIAGNGSPVKMLIFKDAWSSLTGGPCGVIESVI
jgi:hypothetical protein